MVKRGGNYLTNEVFEAGHKNKLVPRGRRLIAPCKPMLDTEVIVLTEVIDAENEPDRDDNPAQPDRRKHSRNPSAQ